MTFSVQHFLPPPRPVHLKPGEVDYRPPGLHLSDIIKYMDQGSGGKGRGALGPEISAPMHLLKGFLWEDCFERSWKHYNANNFLLNQVRIQVNGIHMTSDGIYTGDGYGHESKATAKSSRQMGVELIVTPEGEEIVQTIDGASWEEAERTYIKNFWTWEIQVRGYGYALGAKDWRVVPIFLSGDYRGDKKPQAFVITRHYSDQDLAMTWGMVLTAARKMKAEGHPKARDWKEE